MDKQMLILDIYFYQQLTVNISICCTFSVPDGFKVNPGAVEAIQPHPVNTDKVNVTIAYDFPVTLHSIIVSRPVTAKVLTSSLRKDNF